MSFKLLHIMVLGLLLSASSYAMAKDLLSPQQAEAALNQAFALCSKNLIILDRLVSEKEGKSPYTSADLLLHDTAELEINATKLEQIATAVDACNKQKWPSKLFRLISDLEHSIQLQNTLINLL